MPSYNIIKEDLREVWLSQAKEVVLDNTNSDEFYQRSGNKFIINQILETHLKEFETQLVFFEHSYFATTLDNNKYTVFICIWKKEALSECQLSKFQSFFTEIDKFEKRYPILWHPDFFISPKHLNFYLSDSSDSKTFLDFNPGDFIGEEYTKEQRVFKISHDKDNEVIHVGSFPFELPFEDRVNEVIQLTLSGIQSQPILENNDRLRIVYDTVFEKKKEENEFSYKLAIPILGSPVNNNPLYVGQGSIWIYFITKKKVCEKVIVQLAIDVAGHFKDISINYIFQSGLDLARKTKNHARKAAISQVMARNMSHNHGSHVLSRMIHPDQIGDILLEHEGIRYILSNKITGV